MIEQPEIARQITLAGMYALGLFSGVVMMSFYFIVIGPTLRRLSGDDPDYVSTETLNRLRRDE